MQRTGDSEASSTDEHSSPLSGDENEGKAQGCDVCNLFRYLIVATVAVLFVAVPLFVVYLQDRANADARRKAVSEACRGLALDQLSGAPEGEKLFLYIAGLNFRIRGDWANCEKEFFDSLGLWKEDGRIDESGLKLTKENSKQIGSDSGAHQSVRNGFRRGFDFYFLIVDRRGNKQNRLVFRAIWRSQMRPGRQSIQTADLGGSDLRSIEVANDFAERGFCGVGLKRVLTELRDRVKKEIIDREPADRKHAERVLAVNLRELPVGGAPAGEEGNKSGPMVRDPFAEKCLAAAAAAQKPASRYVQFMVRGQPKPSAEPTLEEKANGEEGYGGSTYLRHIYDMSPDGRFGVLMQKEKSEAKP